MPQMQTPPPPIQDRLDPRTWDDYHGHGEVVQQALLNLQTDHIPKSIFVVGPTGVGKGALVRLYLRSLRCLNRPAGGIHACGACVNCRLDPRTADPSIDDMMWVQMGSGNESLNAQVKNAIEFSQLPPRRIEPDHRHVKVVVVDELETLNQAQVISLYYQSELPPTNGIRTLFIFVTMNEEKAQSQQFRALADRGQLWHLHKHSPRQVQQYLERHFPIDPQSAQLVADCCSGSIRRALEIMGRVERTDPGFSGAAVAHALRAAPAPLRRELWSLVMSTSRPFREFLSFWQSLEGQVDQHLLIRQLLQDIDLSTETAPTGHQFLLKMALLNALHRDEAVLGSILGMFRGHAVVDLRVVEGGIDPLAFLD